MDFIRTRNGLKRYVFPQIETVFSVDLEDEAFQVNTPAIDPAQKIIFGARACDSYALYQQAMVFKQDIVDSLFSAKIDNLVVIVVNCLQPGA